MQRIDFLTKRVTGMVKSTETVKKNVVLTFCLSHGFNDFFFCFQPYMYNVITIMKNQKLNIEFYGRFKIYL